MTTLLWIEKQIQSSPLKRADENHLLIQEIPNTLEKHTEDKHIDFYQEGLVIKMLSREGPKAAVGDVNGDGEARHLHVRCQWTGEFTLFAER